MIDIIVSVSGGRTSAFMAYWMQQNRPAVAEYLDGHPDELMYHFVFANTGMEHEDTLRFMDAVDRNFNLGVVWVESIAHPGQKKASTHRVVDYETAHGIDSFHELDHPFHDHIRKYGIPNVQFLNCTREMKRNAINSYIKSLGLHLADTYTAIGIRDDEKRRVSKNAVEGGILYPLVDLEPVDKQDVLDFWSGFDWDLRIPEWQGNCVTCYKKSFKKLRTVWQETPHVFEFTRFMEQNYNHIGPEFDKYDDAQPRAFFRNRLNTEALIEAFNVTGDVSDYINVMNDAGCSESCEMYEMEGDDG